jgi:hypothetical protein
VPANTTPESLAGRTNTAPWWGLLLALFALGCNAGFFLGVPLQGAIPWLSLVFSAAALIYLALGVWRAYALPAVYKGKVLAAVLTVVALIPAGLSAFGFGVMRKLPSASAAPQVGQTVPELTLPDTSGKPVSLDQLLAPSSPGAPAPKAVLLIFYRGYW